MHVCLHALLPAAALRVGLLLCWPGRALDAPEGGERDMQKRVDMHDFSQAHEQRGRNEWTMVALRCCLTDLAYTAMAYQKWCCAFGSSCRHMQLETQLPILFMACVGDGSYVPMECVETQRMERVVWVDGM